MTTVFVCRPRYELIRQPVVYCASTKCRRPRRMLAYMEPWRGWTHTCLTCGRQCFDGIWGPRPKAERARQRIERAKDLWRRFKGGEIELVED